MEFIYPFFVREREVLHQKFTKTTMHHGQTQTWLLHIGPSDTWEVLWTYRQKKGKHHWIAVGPSLPNPLHSTKRRQPIPQTAHEQNEKEEREIKERGMSRTLYPYPGPTSIIAFHRNGEARGHRNFSFWWIFRWFLWKKTNLQIGFVQSPNTGWERQTKGCSCREQLAKGDHEAWYSRHICFTQRRSRSTRYLQFRRCHA